MGRNQSSLGQRVSDEMPLDGAEGGLHLQARRRVGGMHTDLRRRPAVRDDLFFKPQQQRGAGAPFCRSDSAVANVAGQVAPSEWPFGRSSESAI